MIKNNILQCKKNTHLTYLKYKKSLETQENF